jgi:flagellar hook-length control protein FliK
LPAGAAADAPPADAPSVPASATGAAPAAGADAPARPRAATVTEASPQAVAAAHRATTPPPAAAAAAAVASPALSAGTLERALAAQIVERVGALRHREDGDYELTLQLEPADLGRIELRVRLEGGVVHVQVGAHAPSTTDAVRRALPQLRDALVDAGLTAGSLDVGQHGGGLDRHPGREGTEPTRLPPSDAARPRAISQPSSPIRTDAARGVDVLL